ncbi:MAG: AMP-binding protein [Nannocystaceae bacterium]|nr:AMP-binding protein [Nannocystaceae bacterium]
MPAALAAAAAGRPAAPALRRRVAGAWRPMSWSGWLEAAREIAAGLRTGGVGVGDQVAVVGVEGVAFALLDAGIAFAQAVSVAIPSASPPPEIDGMLAQVHARALVIEPALTGRLLGLSHRPSWVVTAARDDDDERDAEGDALPTLASLRAKGRAALAHDPALRAAIDEAPRRLRADDPWTILFTAGTTGAPRGVLLTHGGASYQGQAIAAAAALGPGDDALLVLPLSQIYARVMLQAAIAAQCTTSFGSPRALERDLTELGPTWLPAVPELLERIGAGFRAETSAAGLAKLALERALEVGRRALAHASRGEPLPLSLALQHKLAHSTVFARLRARLGGRLRFVACGGAPLRRELAELYHAAGVAVLEGYGLTEAGGVVCCNRLAKHRLGTVGEPLPGTAVRIADDGELLVRSPSLGTPLPQADAPPQAASAGERDPQGFLATGDVVELQQGMVRLVDRKRDIIKTQAGKRISPQKLEAQLAGVLGIARALVLGEGERELVALVDLDERELMALSRREGLGCRSRADLAAHPRIRQQVAEGVAALNDTLARHEHIADFALLPEALQRWPGDLTGTGAVRRDAIARRYADVIARMRAALAQAPARADESTGSAPAPWATHRRSTGAHRIPR